ncbi:hypothetical protein ABT340_20625 [Streptosporangium sp. NPDC000239]|uniref:hypothetical protein n=1 Tax=Streptosporangium sp. NPDC000239 TaxID=3154248 RepID=UPI0033336574
MTQGGFQLNQRIISCRETFGPVAYGGHLHHDAEKIQALENLGDLRPVVEWLAALTLVEGLRILQLQRTLIG